MTKTHHPDLDARHYRDHSQPQYGRVHELLHPDQFHESARVLDIGCGDGKITAEIATWVPKGKVIGIDASSNMIELAQSSYPPSKHPNLEFLQGNAEEILFSDRFDKIVCFNCLLWIRQAKRALDQMCNLLKPGGKLLVLTYLKDSSYVHFLEQTLESYPQYKETSAVHTMLSAEECEETLLANNLILKEFQIRDAISNFQSKEELRNYVKGWLGSYVALPHELQESFLNEAVEHSMSHSIDSETHPINLPYKSLVFRAEKPKY